MLGLDCGCETRKETIGADQWWTGVIIAAALTGAALMYGGTVTSQTKSMIRIGTAGAIIAIIANKYVNPTLRVGS